MSLIFAGKTIPGSAGPIIAGGPELQAKLIQYWEVVGEAEIIGRQGGRWLTVEHTLHKSCTTPDRLIAEINKLKGYQGVTGKLTETIDGTSIHYNNCTFRGWEPSALPGQRDTGMLKDVAGTLIKDDGSADGGWFITMQLMFRQLYVSGATS